MTICNIEEDARLNNRQHLLTTRIMFQGCFKSTLVSSTEHSTDTLDQCHDKHVTCQVSNIYHITQDVYMLKAEVLQLEKK